MTPSLFVCLVFLVCFVYLVWHQTDQRDGATNETDQHAVSRFMSFYALHNR